MRKIKRLSAVHCSCCSAHFRPPIKLTAVMSKEPIKKHDQLSRKTCHLSGATRLHCSRNEELRLFLPWLRELLPKFTDLNHLNLYVDLQKAFSAKFEFNSNFFRNPKARMQGRSAVKSALGVRYFCARRFKPVQ